MDQDSPPNKQKPQNDPEQGIWIGIDLGTSNCAASVWDSSRGGPKWMRLKELATPQSRKSKAGRVVPSAVQLQFPDQEGTTNIGPQTILLSDQSLLWKDIVEWNPQWTTQQIKSDALQALQAHVGYSVLRQLEEEKEEGEAEDSSLATPQHTGRFGVITSTKRVMGVCDTTELESLDPAFRKSLPFELEETQDGYWIIPCETPKSNTNMNKNAEQEITAPAIIDLRPVHVAALILQSIRTGAQAYLTRTIPKKKMKVPGFHDNGNVGDAYDIKNAVIGVPAYFGQSQRKAVEEAARLAGFAGHVSTLTESTAAAMAYGLFVGGAGPASSSKKMILVVDMGGGTTDVTVAEQGESVVGAESPHQQFKVILTDGDNRLGGEDMDHVLYELVIEKAMSDSEANSAATAAPKNQLTVQQRQSLTRSCQRAKELLCGDAEHGDPPLDSASVTLPQTGLFATTKITITRSDLDTAIQPLLERTAELIQRVLDRYAEKSSRNTNDQGSMRAHEVILIGGATRVPALRQMLKDRFFLHLELCTSVNAMSAVAQGTAIQAAILSQQVPLHEVRSAMMLDTTPHAIGVLMPGDGGDDNVADKPHRFVEVLARDTPLPANGYATFYVADLDQKGVTVGAVECIGAQQGGTSTEMAMYQHLGDFNFLLHRLSDAQKKSIIDDRDHPGLRPVDIGMTLGTDGAFHVSIFDGNDPDHIRKKAFYQKMTKATDSSDAPEEEGSLLLNYVVKTTTTDWKSEGITAEELKLLLAASLLLVCYFFVKIVLPKHDILPEEDLARIL